VSAFPDDGRTARELIATADVDMYRVKLAAGSGLAASTVGSRVLGEPSGGEPIRRSLGRGRSGRRVAEADPIGD
jgi:hypothetical protein